MNAATLSLDVIVLAVLIATLVRAARLERALHILRGERGAWEAAVGGLGAGTRDAHAGLAELRTTADGIAREVAAQAGRADGLKDDLAFLIERAERACDRLENLVRASRLVGDGAGQMPHPTQDRHPMEQELLAALRSVR